MHVDGLEKANEWTDSRVYTHTVQMKGIGAQPYITYEKNEIVPPPPPPGALRTLCEPLPMLAYTNKFLYAFKKFIS